MPKTPASPETAKPKQGPHRFAPGRSGNPKGRPKGSRHKALLALDAVGAGAAREVLDRVIVAAKSGDMKAADLLLRRLWPERKGQPVSIALPEIATAADLPRATAAVVAAVADGTLTPDEGAAIGAIIAQHREAVVTAELEARMRRIEATMNPAEMED